MFLRLVLLFLSLAPISAGWAGTKLVLVGGGDRPPAAMRQFVDWAGGADAQILIIGWASEQPEVYFETISNDLRAQGANGFTASLRGPESREDVPAFTRQFLAKLGSASAVFFTGGDQTKHMRVIRLPGIQAALQRAYLEGVPFAGTSAGTAIMSQLMLTGEGSEVAPGLGLLPEGVIVDQHARREGRVERDLEAMRENGISKGILIDENNAFTLVDGLYGKMIGPDYVKLFTMEPSGQIRVRELYDGDEIPIWPLGSRRRGR